VEDGGLDELRGSLREVEMVRLKDRFFCRLDSVEVIASSSCKRLVEEVKLVH
jgi:hypothetical protein